jgi:hypothetical protein
MTVQPETTAIGIMEFLKTVSHEAKSRVQKSSI